MNATIVCDTLFLFYSYSYMNGMCLYRENEKRVCNICVSFDVVCRPKHTPFLLSVNQFVCVELQEHALSKICHTFIKSNHKHFPFKVFPTIISRSAFFFPSSWNNKNHTHTHIKGTTSYCCRYTGNIFRN